MKKYLVVLAAMFMLGGVAIAEDMSATAAPNEPMAKDTAAMKKGHMKKDCIMMKDGKMMVMKGGNVMPMDSDMTMPNGTMVMKDGSYMMKDGPKMMFKEGEKMDMNGKMMKMKKMKTDTKTNMPQ